MEYIIDFYSYRKIQLVANTVLPDNFKRADLFIIELLT